MSQHTIQRSTEEAAVRDLYQQFMDAWNRGSGADLAAVFTPDGDLVGFDGTHLKGRQLIASHNQRLFDRWLRGDSIQTLVATGTEGAWHLAAFQNTRLRRMSEQARPFLLWTLSDWLWKVARLNKPAAYPYDTTSALPPAPDPVAGA
jgi:ketosteroid isomerase-like protein